MIDILNSLVRRAEQAKSMSHSANDLDRPLVVDLDGTLFKTDFLWESFLRCLLNTPARFFRSLGVLMRGRNHFKKYLADQMDIDILLYPISEDVLQFLSKQKSAGRRLILATGATEDIVKAVLRSYPLFDEVLASNIQVNLVGLNKGFELERRFGKKGFDYLGDALADLNVWSKCRIAYFTNINFVTKIALRFIHSSCIEVGKRSLKSSVKNFVKTLHIHQWTKNLLIILPFLAAYRPIETSSIKQLSLGLFAFSLVASTVYLINDLVNMENDRNHPTRRMKPIAAGDLSIPIAILTVFILGSTGILLALLLDQLFALMVAIYFFLACIYSLWLKKMVVLDVILLTVLYTMRVIAGGALVNVRLSNWFLVLSVFFLFSLALLKRYIEPHVIAP